VPDAHGVVLTGSPTSGSVQNSISAADTTFVLHWHCRENHCAPHSPTLHGYYLIKRQWQPHCNLFGHLFAKHCHCHRGERLSKTHCICHQCSWHIRIPKPSAHDEPDGPKLVHKKPISRQAWNWIFAPWDMVICWLPNRMCLQHPDWIINTHVFKFIVNCIENRIGFWASTFWIEDLLSILHLLLNLPCTFVSVLFILNIHFQLLGCKLDR